jgi:hypothetical protein
MLAHAITSTRPTAVITTVATLKMVRRPSGNEKLLAMSMIRLVVRPGCCSSI